MYDNALSDAELRRRQIDDARQLAAGEIGARALEGDGAEPRATLTMPARRARTALAPKGHEAFLKALEAAGATVLVEKVGGCQVVGVLRHSDKYTVTLRTAYNGGTRDRVLFKHDISEFSALTPRKAPEAE